MRAFAALCRELRATKKTSRKTSLVAQYLSECDDESLPLAARFLTGRPFAAKDERKLSVGGATLFRVAAEMFPEIDPETLGDSFRAVGDMGESFGLLQRGRGREGEISLPRVHALCLSLSESGKAEEKVRMLLETLTPLAPDVLKETVKLLVGSQRIGLSFLLLEQAIAQAAGVAIEEVKRAALLSGDAGDVALKARRGELSHAALTLFHPMGFQLAAVYEPGDALPWQRLIVEEKFDGIRCQAHVEPGSAGSMGRVALFSRTLDEITKSFPDVVAALALVAEPLVADGEVLAFENGRALPFARLQKRLHRKTVTADMIRDVPLVFVFYDLLAFRGDLVIDRPLHERRALLEALALPPGTLLSHTARAGNEEELERLFTRALEHGNEGLMLKDVEAPYAPGKRGRSWLKFKKARATLDVVVTAVEPGHGKRAGLLSDLTFAVRGPGGALLNVGKAYSGLSDAEIEETTRLFKRITEKVYGGRVRAVRPEVVIEVAFDGIQESARHKSGYALRFPRILRLRPDKPPSEIDTLDRVKELYEELLTGWAAVRERATVS